MHNLILGVFFGWLLFSINGTETFWKTYRVLDKMGDTIAEGMVKDIVPAKPESKEETIVDTKREAYMKMCQSYGNSVKQCQTYWDQDDQTVLTETDKPVKIKQHKPTEQPS